MRTLLLILLLLLSGTRAAHAEANGFGDVLVQWNGRIMSAESCARALLLQFSGRSRPADKSPAASWLADVLFEPATREHDPVFLIEHPELLASLGFENTARARRAPADLFPAFGDLHRLAARVHLVPESNRGPLHNETLRLEENLATYMELTNAFSAYRPELDVSGQGQHRLAEFHLREDRLLAVLQSIQGGNTTGADQLVAALQQPAPEQTGHFPIWPIGKIATSPWASPSTLLPSSEISTFESETHSPIPALTLLQLAEAHSTPDRFHARANELRRLQQADLPPHLIRRADLESMYHTVRPFFWSTLLYGIALLVLLLRQLPIMSATVTWSSRPDRKTAFQAGGALLIVAFVLHTLGLLARILITGRPPVTNLHATFLFVSWVMVLVGLLLEWRFRRGTGWVAACAAGLLLLLVANRWAAEGDSLGVLVAVLDSNFWLSTHVIAITLGYAGVALAGLLAHGVLWQSATGTPPRRELLQSMEAALRFGLLFTFLGTVLGGVWADRSWGRFWGWDPKENGALLLILWTAILFHARLAGWLRDPTYAAGCVLGILVLLFAWLGTNLLGVGLHAYGFTSGVTRWLVAFTLFELAFVNTCLFLNARRSSTTPRSTASG